MQSVVEVHPELWHYTTASGLQGILSSQQLWATDIFYLNDAEEFTGFFDRKLLQILEEAVKEGLADFGQTAEGLKEIDAAGGYDSISSKLPSELRDILRNTTLKLQPYVTSFCAPSSHDGNDGLLSQWRGYGPDGGYAIVFDTPAMEDLLHEEQKSYFYAFGHWGNVDYYTDTTGGEVYEETAEWVEAIQSTIARIVAEGDLNLTQNLFEPILSLATRHKHRGFREEAEVRISVVPTMLGVTDDEARAKDDHRPNKTIHFTSRNGILVPYIALFERPEGGKAKLPINKIVVGPHPDRFKRKKAVEKMLYQLGIEATVVTSDIPFLGR